MFIFFYHDRFKNVNFQNKTHAFHYFYAKFRKLNHSQYFMKKKEFLFLLLVVIVAFWQVSFLQNAMKWDFVDAFLPSRYFFSESIVNNQFPLWNPYLLYGTPIYADLVSVFSPEYWLVGNMFGYSNISLQYVYLAYIFIAGVSFFYFLKQFGAESKLSLGLSVAYMLSGLSIGNAQHLAFVAGFAIIPFVISCYFKFLQNINKPNFILLAIALFLMVYVSYPGLTIILAYFLFGIFLYFSVKYWSNKDQFKKLLVYHFFLLITVILFSSVLLVAYVQAFPFLSRYGGISAELALRHPFSLQSFVSFLLPMASGNDAQYFETDMSMSNGYYGIIGLVLFLFSLIRKVKYKESYLILLLGLFSLWAALGEQFLFRKFLFDFAPLMDMFKYPSIFRAFAIFSFLAFVGLNFDLKYVTKTDRNKILMITGLVIFVLLMLIWHSALQLNDFVFFDQNKSFVEEIRSADRFSNILFQGVFQVILLMGFGGVVWKVKESKHFASAVVLFFVIDGIVATQLSIYYSVVSEVDPVEFYDYLQSSPKGFPIPELNPMGENSDKNAASEFTWMNNNVFPKKVTYDGLVSFKLDGYSNLADNFPELLTAIKKEALVYFSDDVRENTRLANYKSNTVFLCATDYKKLGGEQFISNEDNQLSIDNFSPTNIEITARINSSQLLVYQQNYYSGWSVFVDGKKQDLLKSNFAHMAVLVPEGEHTVVFTYSNSTVIFAFGFTAFIFVLLLVMYLYYFLVQHPEKKRSIFRAIVFCLVIFVVASGLNRYFYAKNKEGLSSVIVQKINDWKENYRHDINIFLSTQQNELKNQAHADTICFVDEKMNLAELSHFLLGSETNYFAFAWQGGMVKEDILELIYSFYPVIIDSESDNNSGIVLLSKSADDDSFVYCEDFESDTFSGWSIDKRRVENDSVNGNSSYHYGVNDKWGTTLSVPIDTNLVSLNKILLVADFRMEDETDEVPLIFAIKRDGKQLQYDAELVNKFVKYPDEWSRAAVIFELKNKLKEGDLIQIYFWNKGAGRFQIDNIKLKLYYWE